MSKTFSPWLPAQASLLPLSTSDWLSTDHLVYFFLDLENVLDHLEIVITS